jgi:hypothetical protein
MSDALHLNIFRQPPKIGVSGRLLAISSRMMRLPGFDVLKMTSSTVFFSRIFQSGALAGLNSFLSIEVLHGFWSWGCKVFWMREKNGDRAAYLDRLVDCFLLVSMVFERILNGF